jgi:hypothetical protein
MGSTRKATFLGSIALLFFFTSSLAQVQNDSIYNENIKTVLVYPAGTQNDFPVIAFGNNARLNIEFDDLSGAFQNFTYVIVPCNPDWTINNTLQPEEFMAGYNVQNIPMGQNSYNTRVKYIHYSYQFPNNDIQLKISGNFMMVVYDDPNLSNIIFQKRFIVVEEQDAINAKVVLPRNNQYYDTHHQIDCSVLLSKIDPLSNPIEQLRLTVLQNDDPKTFQMVEKPTFIRADELIYQNIFMEAGNEFRRVDLRSVLFKTENIAKIYDLDVYKVVIATDKNLDGTSYVSNTDFSGNFFVDVREFDNDALTADYVKVSFSLQPRFSYGVKYFLDMKALEWKADEQSKMSYDRPSGVFSKTVLLKQGLYNYRYYSVREGEDLHYTSEGNFFQSQQQYRVLLYYKPFGYKYFRCITNKSFFSH